MKIVPAAETEQRLEGIWPEFLLHDAISNRLWPRLDVDFPAFQFVALEGDELITEGNCIPVRGMPAHWGDAPGALVPVSVRDGHGTYREQCVWVDHPR